MYCIYHSRDLDGWMSAAVVKLWHDENPDKAVSKDELIMIGYDYGNPLPAILADKQVIMVDISFPKEIMLELYRNNHLIWIDHHISAIKDNTEINVNKVIYNGLTDTKFAACELTWKYFFPDEPMPEVVRLLGRYDCFGHKGTSEEQKVLEFQYGARANMFDVDTCYRVLTNWTPQLEHSIQVAGYEIYNYLCAEAEADYKNVFPITLSGYNVAVLNKQRFNPINFGIDYHKDGYDAFLCFHYANKKWNFSLYNDNGKVDCSVICKEFGGGGHAGAAGFVAENMDSIFNNL